MTAIGRGSTAKIAAACDDGTVRIYDSVTGVLKLTLRPEFPVLEMTGLPDGSLLVCTHSGRHLITLWDFQTGGLVQSFILQGEVKHTAVSLKGRYLACETSKRAVNFWETASRQQHPDPLEQFEGNTPCWLAPEELIMVVDGRSVYIRNVATKGLPIRKFDVSAPVHSAVYSQIFDRLVIMSPSFRGGASFTTLDVETGASSTLRRSGGRISFVAFSQTTERLVCGGGDTGLETIDISTGRQTRFDSPATVASISTLSDDTVVANIRGSGIQLLRLDQEHAPPRQPTPPTRTMYPLDKGRIITIVSATNARVILLETATMSRVLSIPTQEGVSVGTDHTVVLCASLENKIAVRSFVDYVGGNLQVWEFSRKLPRWTERTGGLLVGTLSPSCARLVTFHNGRSQSSVLVWDAYDGRHLARTSIDKPHAPCTFDITFDSEDRVSLYHDAHWVSYIINAASRTGQPDTHSISRCAEKRLDEPVSEERYRLDDGSEWVFCGSQRICWVPPGYIGPCHCWAGTSLVMAGEDGTLRRLTFSESPL